MEWNGMLYINSLENVCYINGIDKIISTLREREL